MVIVPTFGDGSGDRCVVATIGGSRYEHGGIRRFNHPWAVHPWAVAAGTEQCHAE